MPSFIDGVYDSLALYLTALPHFEMTDPSHRSIFGGVGCYRHHLS